jgi:hypothetical protein
MYVMEDGQTAYFDVDNTLVLWEKDINKVIYGPLSKDTVSVEELESYIKVNLNGFNFYFRPITVHVNQLIQQKLKGLRIVVWSASGASWAEAVIKALKLSDFVDVILTKPNFYYDDRKADHFMKNYYFFAEEEIKLENDKMTLPKFVQSQND